MTPLRRLAISSACLVWLGAPAARASQGCLDAAFSGHYICEGGGCGYDAVAAAVADCEDFRCTNEVCQTWNEGYQIYGCKAGGGRTDGSCNPADVQVVAGGEWYDSAGHCACVPTEMPPE